MNGTTAHEEIMDMDNTDKEAIKAVIEKAYIEGIHGDQDQELVRAGFHEDFTMLVLKDNAIEKVSVDEWLIRVELMKRENPEMWAAETRYLFDQVDVSGTAAAAKLQVFKGEIHFSMDYMLLYHFEDGWRIVSKIFAIPS